MRIATNRKMLALAGLLGAIACTGHTGCGDGQMSVRNDPPAVPSGVFTVTGDGWVDVYWSAVREDDVAGYGIYRSATAEGAYQRIGTNDGVESTSFRDDGAVWEIVNGTTYYYAVDAFDSSGRESSLSYEEVFDTPRPAGHTTVYAKEFDAARSGIDFSSHAPPGPFVRAFDDAETDLVFQRVGAVLFAKGTVRQVGQQPVPNDIQDLGYTETFDEISWAPGDGWSVAPDGVELITGHTYVVWTWEEYYAKFRVVEVQKDPSEIPTGVEIDWAYQIDQQNPELRPLYTRHQEPVNAREDS